MDNLSLLPAKDGHVDTLIRAQLALFDYPDSFFPCFSQLLGKCLGITCTVEAQPALFPGKAAQS